MQNLGDYSEDFSSNAFQEFQETNHEILKTCEEKTNDPSPQVASYYKAILARMNREEGQKRNALTNLQEKQTKALDVLNRIFAAAPKKKIPASPQETPGFKEVTDFATTHLSESGLFLFLLARSYDAELFVTALSFKIGDNKTKVFKIKNSVFNCTNSTEILKLNDALIADMVINIIVECQALLDKKLSEKNYDLDFKLTGSNQIGSQEGYLSVK